MISRLVAGDILNLPYVLGFEYIDPSHIRVLVSRQDAVFHTANAIKEMASPGLLVEIVFESSQQTEEIN